MKCGPVFLYMPKKTRGAILTMVVPLGIGSPYNGSVPKTLWLSQHMHSERLDAVTLPVYAFVEVNGPRRGGADARNLEAGPGKDECLRTRVNTEQAQQRVEIAAAILVCELDLTAINACLQPRYGVLGCDAAVAEGRIFGVVGEGRGLRQQERAGPLRWRGDGVATARLGTPSRREAKRQR